MPGILDLSMYGIGNGVEQENDAEEEDGEGDEEDDDGDDEETESYEEDDHGDGDEEENDAEETQVIDLTMDQDGDDQSDAESGREDEADEDDEEEKEVIDLTMDQDGDDQTATESEREDTDDHEDDEEQKDPCPGYNYMIVDATVTGRKRATFEGIPWSRARVSINSKKLFTRNKHWRWKCLCRPARCNATFERSYTLWVHMEALHIVGGRSFRCEVAGCGKSYSQKSGLMTHIRGKHLAPFDDYWKWKCSECGQGYNCNMQASRCCRDANHNR